MQKLKTFFNRFLLKRQWNVKCSNNYLKHTTNKIRWGIFTGTPAPPNSFPIGSTFVLFF